MFGNLSVVALVSWEAAQVDEVKTLYMSGVHDWVGQKGPEGLEDYFVSSLTEKSARPVVVAGFAAAELVDAAEDIDGSGRAGLIVCGRVDLPARGVERLVDPEPGGGCVSHVGMLQGVEGEVMV